MSIIYFVWAKSKQDELATQLVTIGANLSQTEDPFGMTGVEITQWMYGAAVNEWLQLQLIPRVRDFSVSITAARDELQLDKTVATFALPVFNAPPPPVMPVGITTLDTDFVDWCDRLYQRMRLTGGLSDSQAIALGFLVPPPTPPTPVSDLKARVVSIDTQAGGKTVVTCSRDNQKMVHCRLTLDTGVVLEKTLANSQFTFDVPTDRVHHFEAQCIYADKNGDDIGNWGDIKSDTSEL